MKQLQSKKIIRPDASKGRFLAGSIAIFCFTLGIGIGLLCLLTQQNAAEIPLVQPLSPTVQPNAFQALVIWVSVFGTGVTIFLLAFLGVAMYIVHTLIHPKRENHFIPLSPFVLGLPGEDIQFPPLFGNHQVRGLYVPRAGASTTIIISPGYRRSLADVLGMCKHLWQAGHHVLALEFFGHGEAVGTRITLGYREINDFLGAVEYAKMRAPQTRLGALGYSMGGAISIMGAARANDVEAVIADSSFATHWSAVETTIRRTLHFLPRIPIWSLRLLYHLTDRILWWRAGYHFHQVEPLQDIQRLAPRAVLLIHGLRDTVVAPEDAYQLYQAAAKPKALWLIPETEHIKGYFSDSTAYVARVTAFFERYLKQQARREPAPERVLSQTLPETGTVGEHNTLQRDIHTVVSGGQSSTQRQTAHRQGSVPEAASARGIFAAFGNKYGQFVYRFRWFIIVSWALILLASIPFARNVSIVLVNSGYSISSSESSAVDTQVVSRLHQPATQLLVVFQSAGVPVTAPAYQQEVSTFIRQAENFPHVITLTRGGESQNTRSTFVAVGFDQDKDQLAERIPDFRKILPQADPARVYLTGDSAVANEIQLDTQLDTESAEMLALPLTLFVLLLVFGSVAASIMPLLLAGVAVPTALAAIDIIALHITTNIFVLNVASIIGLGLSIDYSLFIVRRFREELALGHSVQESITTTILTAGEAILFSGIIVIIGFAGLFFIGINIMNSFGIGGITVVLVAVLSALTLLPALLAVLGKRINALRIPFVGQLVGRLTQKKNAPARPGFWQRWAMFVMRKPLSIILLVSILLLLLGWPARVLNPENPGVASLPVGSEAKAGLQILQTLFPEINTDPIYVLVKTGDGSNILRAQNIRRVDQLSQWLATQAHITDVQSLTKLPKMAGTPTVGLQSLIQIYSTGAYKKHAALQMFVTSTTEANTTLIVLRSDTQDGTSADQALIDHLRSIPLQMKQGLITQVGGARVVNLDFDRTLYHNFIRTLAFILLATYLLLLVMFRSVLLPFKAILMNAISISASYGALVFIFQQGHFQQFFGFTADGSIDRFVPILLFCILFGLSMDYEVFLLTRIREEWQRTQDNSASVVLGLEKTGSAITSAAALFVIVSSAFITTSLIVTKELGLGITVSILVDASIIRCMLVPATMQLMGRWNWWLPRRSHRTLAPSLQGLPSSSSQTKNSEVDLVITTPRISTMSKEQVAKSQQNTVEQVLMYLFMQILEIPSEAANVTSNFFELGGDSDSLDLLLSEIEQQFRVRLQARDIFSHPVIFRLAAIIIREQTRNKT